MSMGKTMITQIINKNMDPNDKENYWICVICDKEFYKGAMMPNNADPVKQGDCCDICNADQVIPERVKQFVEFMKKEE